jgi:hypothetical protein
MFLLLQDNMPVLETAAGAAAGLDGLLGTAAVLFALFLVVATVAEQLMELFRGTIEQLFGVTLLKGGLTLEQAQKIAADALPAEGAALAKANALVAMGGQFPKTLEKKKAEIAELRTNVAKALGPKLTGQVEAEVNMTLTKLTTEVRTMVESTESARIYLLRLLTCCVCVGLCLVSDFNAFAIAGKDLGVNFLWLSQTWGTFLTGFAAASGSSYWHDALDKIRATKSSIGQMRAVVSV